MTDFTLRYGQYKIAKSDERKSSMVIVSPGAHLFSQSGYLDRAAVGALLGAGLDAGCR